MVTIVIDATGSIFGRICSFAAKKAIEGDEVNIVNSEKSIVTGNKKFIIDKYAQLRAKGGFSQKGPKYSIAPERMLKRGIRGMLPDFRKGQGKLALERIQCYKGIPEHLINQKMITITSPKKFKYIELKELSEKI